MNAIIEGAVNDQEKLHAEIAKLIAETFKLGAETAKIQAETRWYPLIALVSVLGAVSAVLYAIIKHA